MVVREVAEEIPDHTDHGQTIWTFGAVIGVYQSLNRADEIAGSSMQQVREIGYTEDEIRFTVKASNYYDE